MFQSTSPHMETCIHTRARPNDAEQNVDSNSETFRPTKRRVFCFLRWSLYISLREFKIEKEKRVSRDRLELASPERNSRIGRTNNFLAIELFLSLLCVLSLFVNGNWRKEATILRHSRSFCHVNDNIFSFFCSFLYFSFLSHFSVSTSKLSFSSLLSLIYLSIYLSLPLPFVLRTIHEIVDRDRWV